VRGARFIFGIAFSPPQFCRPERGGEIFLGSFVRRFFPGPRPPFYRIEKEVQSQNHLSPRDREV
jgi:hypothetical protein